MLMECTKVKFWFVILDEACAENTALTSKFRSSVRNFVAKLCCTTVTVRSSFFLGSKIEFSPNFFMAWCRHVLKSRDPKEFTAAVHRLALKSAWQEALQVLDDMENVHPPNMFVHNAVMDACKRGQQWAVAMQLFESLESKRLEADLVTFNIISTGDPFVSWRHMRQQRLQPDAVSYVAAVSGYEVEGAWQQALALLMEAIEMDLANIILCSAVISACDKGKQWQRALFLLNSLDRKDNLEHTQHSQDSQDLQALQALQALQPTVVTFNSAISACGRARHWARALNLLQRLVNQQRLTPTTASFRAALAATGRQRLWRQSLALLQQMRQLRLELNAWMLNGLRWTYRKAKQRSLDENWAETKWEEALLRYLSQDVRCPRGFTEFCDNDFQPNEVLRLLHHSGKMQLAQQLWHRLFQSTSFAPSLIGLLIMLDVCIAKTDPSWLHLFQSSQMPGMSGPLIRLAMRHLLYGRSDLWIFRDESMDYSGNILRAMDFLYSVSPNSFPRALHGSMYRASMKAFQESRRSSSVSPAPHVHNLVLEHQFALGLCFTPLALTHLGLRFRTKKVLQDVRFNLCPPCDCEVHLPWRPPRFSKASKSGWDSPVEPRWWKYWRMDGESVFFCRRFLK